MQYLILIHDTPATWMAMSEAEQNAGMAEYTTFTEDLRERGILRAGAPLDRSATIVRVRDGQTAVTDGPYAESHEQLGGYYIVETDTVEEAVAVAAGVPSARWGTIEVRPLRPM
jgi:hypothetical protein